MRISNITELIWNDEWAALLRICGEKEAAVGASASDYERFLAICRSAHLLRGNPMLHRLSSFLTELLKHPISLSQEVAEEIWRETAAYFLFADDVRDLWETFEASPMEAPRDDACPRLAASDFWNGDCLLNTAASSWETWSEEICQRCDQAFEDAFQGVMLTLTKGFVFSSPHPYSVERALQREERDQREQGLLLSQLFRVLAVSCLEREKTIVCRVECDPTEAIKLFSYAEGQVGLPRLIWCLEAFHAPAGLIAFSGRYHKNSVEAAQPKNETTAARLQDFSGNYPFGNLWIFL